MKKINFISNGKTIFPYGGQSHNSSGYGADDLDQTFKALHSINANAVEIPIYWEQVEQEENTFDFSGVYEIWKRVQAEGLYLIFLWFGTWKNGTFKYVPQWVKNNPERFWRVSDRDGHYLATLSPHCRATMEADAKAFSALASYLKTIDEDKKTLIALQVENEPGIMNGPERDFSPEAIKLFESPIPDIIREEMLVHPESNITKLWRRMGSQTENWLKSFGGAAGELFTAYHIAQYVETVAKAGKQQFDILMYTNVWLQEHRLRLPGMDYPSGGPVGNTLDIWKWHAPALDFIAPDNYQQIRTDYMSVCQTYNRLDNPLFIPESGLLEWNSRFMFEAMAKFDSIGMFIFGVESILDTQGKIKSSVQAVAESMQILSAAAGGLLHYRGNRIEAVVQEEYAQYQYIEFNGYVAIAYFTYCHPLVGRSDTDWNWHGYNYADYIERQEAGSCRGRGIVIQSKEDEFFVCGDGFQLIFVKKSEQSGVIQAMAGSTFHLNRSIPYLSIEEGIFTMDGEFISNRRRNGDEADFGIWVEPGTGVVRVRLCGIN